jgi:hypothetical protein
MRVLVTQHHPDEGPGLLGYFLTAQAERIFDNFVALAAGR